MWPPRTLPWILTIFCVCGVLLQCGRKSAGKSQVPEPIDLGPFVPKDWDMQSDWPQNALKAKDI